MLLVPMAVACGPWQRVGQEAEPVNVTAERLPQILDPTRPYREIGLLTDAGPLGFIGVARVVAGPRADSVLLALGLSLRTRGLTFRRESEGFAADYRVEIMLRRGNSVARQLMHDERIRVTSFRETQRSDESVIFQEFVPLAPGQYSLEVTVRDRNGPNYGRAEQAINVPSAEGAAVSLPFAVYEASGRASNTVPPVVVMNPRQSVEYGADSIRFYIEAYGAAPRTWTATAEDATGRPVWRDTVRFEGPGTLRWRIITVPPQALAIGRYELRLSQDSTIMAATPFLVSFSDQYAVGNLEELVSLLRYFPHVDTLRAALRLPPEERAAAWRRFFRLSDPVSTTPENEAIDDYVARVGLANERFRDEGVGGWLTERGEVFITLGEPNEILDRRPDMGRGRYIVWNYYDHRLQLYFVDDAGFGRFRLDPRSRAEFQRVRNMLEGR